MRTDDRGRRRTAPGRRSCQVSPENYNGGTWLDEPRLRGEAGKGAVGKVVIREKEHLVAVRPFDGAMVMSTLFYADEIRRLEDVEELQTEAKIHPNERKMAMQLIDGLTAVVHSAAPKPEKVVDLMDALRRSLELARKGKSQPAPVRRGASRAQAAAAMRERHRSRHAHRSSSSRNLDGVRLMPAPPPLRAGG